MVPAAPAAEARVAFAAWCARHPDLVARLADGDLRVDIVRGGDGLDRRAYRVSLDAADAALLDARDRDAAGR